MSLQDQIEEMEATYTFLPIADMNEWQSFVEANADVLAEIADEATCLALAQNCELIVGGGAGVLFRVGFVD